MDKRSFADELEIAVEVQVAPAFAGAVSEERLQQIAEAVLRHEARPGQMTVVLTDDVGIQQLNHDFLGIDAPTDVLSFSAQEDGSPFVGAPEASGYLGDVIISYPQAVAQAEELGHPVGAGDRPARRPRHAAPARLRPRQRRGTGGDVGQAGCRSWAALRSITAARSQELL